MLILNALNVYNFSLVHNTKCLQLKIIFNWRYFCIQNSLFILNLWFLWFSNALFKNPICKMFAILYNVYKFECVWGGGGGVRERDRDRDKQRQRESLCVNEFSWTITSFILNQRSGLTRERIKPELEIQGHTWLPMTTAILHIIFSSSLETSPPLKHHDMISL